MKQRATTGPMKFGPRGPSGVFITKQDALHFAAYLEDYVLHKLQGLSRVIIEDLKDTLLSADNGQGLGKNAVAEMKPFEECRKEEKEER